MFRLIAQSGLANKVELIWLTSLSKNSRHVTLSNTLYYLYQRNTPSCMLATLNTKKKIVRWLSGRLHQASISHALCVHQLNILSFVI